MSEPELHVRDFTPPMLAAVCDSGRHHAHPGETCEEIDELQAAFRAYLERALAAAYASAIAETDAALDRFLISGEGSGECRGFLPRQDVPEPTPVERALAILDPHLRACPLYKSGPPGLTVVAS